MTDLFTCDRCSRPSNLSEVFDEENLFKPFTGQGVNEFVMLSSEDTIPSCKESVRKADIARAISSWIERGGNFTFCENCTCSLSETLQNAIIEAEEDSRRYQQFLAQKPELDLEESALDAEIKSLKQKNTSNRDFLNDLERARALTLTKIHRAERNLEEVKKEETNFWGLCNRFEDQLVHYQGSNQATKMRKAYYSDQLKMVDASQPFREVFDIRCNQPIGTINGLRLGTLPTEVVPVAEINAACGVCAQFLWAVSLRLDPRRQFFSYRVRPLGGQSTIETMERTVYELYDSTEQRNLLQSFLWYSSFDKGLGAFLKCLQEVSDLIVQKELSRAGFLPHAIEDDTVGGMSIRKGMKNNQFWTDAIKKMLENMQVICKVMDRLQWGK